MPDEFTSGTGAPRPSTKIGIDTEELTGQTFPYQFDRSLVDDVDLIAATPGEDLNWLEDVHLMYEDGIPAVFDRYTNAFIKIHFEIPPGREDEYARKVLITHLREETLTESGSSAGTPSSPSPNSAPGPPVPAPVADPARYLRGFRSLSACGDS